MTLQPSITIRFSFGFFLNLSSQPGFALNSILIFSGKTFAYSINNGLDTGAFSACTCLNYKRIFVTCDSLTFSKDKVLETFLIFSRVFEILRLNCIRMLLFEHFLFLQFAKFLFLFLKKSAFSFFLQIFHGFKWRFFSLEKNCIHNEVKMFGLLFIFCKISLANTIRNLF